MIASSLTGLEQVLFPGEHIRIDSCEFDTPMCGVYATSTAPTAACPQCGTRSAHRHSHYERTLADCSIASRPLRIYLRVRRFRCRHAACPQQIFGERLPSLVEPSARRTVRLTQWLRALGLALGGAAGARLSQRLGIPIGDDTLLRIVKGLPEPLPSEPKVVGIDEWAWRKRTSYGCILVDLETHAVLDLLPVRSVADCATWFATHPSIHIISRDRGGGFATAATQGAPQAHQVVDRWHLIKNFLAALESIFLGKRTLLTAVSTALHPESPPPPAYVGRLTRSGASSDAPGIQAKMAERQTRHETYVALYTQIHTLREAGAAIKTIVERTQVSRRTVYRYLAMDNPPVWTPPRVRVTALDPYKAYLHQRWEHGCQIARKLWQEIQAQGYPGCEASVYTYLVRTMQRATRAAPIHPTGALTNGRVPSAGQTAHWIALTPESRTPRQQGFLTNLAHADPDSADAIAIAEAFLAMIRDYDADAFPAWLERVCGSSFIPFQRFGQRLQKEYAATKAGIRGPWSNGPVEGHIHRLKLLKRQMYGRAGFKLLRNRLIYRV